MKFIYLLLFFFLIGINNLNAQNNTPKPMHGYGKQIAPDNCLVQAQIVKIIPARKKISKQKCKNAPCIAIIKIIKVEKYGRTFNHKLNKGQKIKVKFECSLKEIKEKKLPGLKKGNTFKAEITHKEKLNSKSSEFTISNYQKLL